MVEYLETREDRSVSTKSLCGLARIVLKKNNFKVSNKIPHKQLVTAISTKFSPLYTNLFMAGLKECIFEYSGYYQYP